MWGNYTELDVKSPKMSNGSAVLLLCVIIIMSAFTVIVSYDSVRHREYECEPKWIYFIDAAHLQSFAVNNLSLGTIIYTSDSVNATIGKFTVISSKMDSSHTIEAKVRIMSFNVEKLLVAWDTMVSCLIL